MEQTNTDIEYIKKLYNLNIEDFNTKISALETLHNRKNLLAIDNIVNLFKQYKYNNPKAFLKLKEKNKITISEVYYFSDRSIEDFAFALAKSNKFLLTIKLIVLFLYGKFIYSSSFVKKMKKILGLNVDKITTLKENKNLNFKLLMNIIHSYVNYSQLSKKKINFTKYIDTIYYPIQSDFSENKKINNL